jgi:CheY-like chemotaxis protein
MPTDEGSSKKMTVAPLARPRVLLADDHIAFLESVSRLLAAAFDIVALAGDGRQALDLARRLRPDVVVLDVAMPELGGFQTLQKLRLTRTARIVDAGGGRFVSAAINAARLRAEVADARI